VASVPEAGETPPARVRLAVAIGTPVLRALARTWRFREVGREDWRARRAAGLPTVVALWHGQMLPLTVHHRGMGIAILISEHHDGEIIARVARAFGLEAVRGSTSRGGARALLELVTTLRTGRDVAVTPDGPRGPRLEFAPGALVAAHRAGAAVVGIAAHVDRAWRLRSWDAFEIPKPFARITVAYTPARVVPGASAREAAAAAETFGAELRALLDVAAAAGA
jgi:lysophospholipid acyltransferase (LPLAT)-like uncharacterized protein